MIQELSKRKLAELDEMFEDYQHVDDDISRREFQIRYPWRESDQNIGGGKSATTADGEQRLLEAIEADKRITYLRKLKTACATCVCQMDAAMLKVYKMRYQSPARYDWSELPEAMNYSRAWVYRRRYAILELLAKEWGLLS